MTQLQVIDRLAAWVASRRYAVVAAACPEPLDASGALGYRREQHLVEEVAVAARVGEGTARSLVETARLLAGPDAPFETYAHALAAGQVSAAHIRVLVRGTLRVTGNPDTPREVMLARIAQLTLPAAMRGTPAQLDKAVLAAVCVVDPEGEADRRAAARDARDVYRWADRGTERRRSGHDNERSDPTSRTRPRRRRGPTLLTVQFSSTGYPHVPGACFGT